MRPRRGGPGAKGRGADACTWALVSVRILANPRFPGGEGYFRLPLRASTLKPCAPSWRAVKRKVRRWTKNLKKG